jgi:type I restriction enzyme, S subunit
LMNDWPLVTIGGLGQVFDGPHATPKTVAEGPVFLGISALQNGRINLGETRHVTPEDFKKWTRRVEPRAGDVVFSYETRLGEAAVIPKGLTCCLGRRMGLVRVDERKIRPRFFLYNYISPPYQEFLRSRTIHGATVDRIPLRELHSFPFPCPPLDQQDSIVALLGALDDKIELNRQTNETLEALARAIFKDWFVDFGPTRAKAERRAPYLAPELWDLFPDRLDAEGKPEGWQEMTLGELAKATHGTIRTGPFGSQLHKADYVAEGVPVVMPANLTTSEIRRNGIAQVNDGTADRLRDHKLSVGDIVYGRRGDIGRKALVGVDESGWLCGTGCLRISIHSPESPSRFLFYHLDQEAVRDWLTTRAVGATMPNLNTKILSEIPVLLPKTELPRRFDDAAAALVGRIAANRRESLTLTQTRDLLLPKLMSGEIRVRDAEAAVAAVL